MGIPWSSASTATTIHYAEKPALIPVREEADAAQGEGELDLRTLVEKRCPSLHKPFVPAWWLPKCVVGCSLQSTMLTSRSQWTCADALLRFGRLYQV